MKLLSCDITALTHCPHPRPPPVSAPVGWSKDSPSPQKSVTPAACPPRKEGGRVCFSPHPWDTLGQACCSDCTWLQILLLVFNTIGAGLLAVLPRQQNFGSKLGWLTFSGRIQEPLK